VIFFFFSTKQQCTIPVSLETITIFNVFERSLLCSSRLHLFILQKKKLLSMLETVFFSGFINEKRKVKNTAKKEKQNKTLNLNF